MAETAPWKEVRADHALMSGQGDRAACIIAYALVAFGGCSIGLILGWLMWG